MKLRKDITRKYSKSLNLSIMGACELADLVRWNEITLGALFTWLDELVANGETINR